MGDSEVIFEKVEAAVPGFINFWLKPEEFQKELPVILKNKDKYGKNNNLKGQKSWWTILIRILSKNFISGI